MKQQPKKPEQMEGFKLAECQVMAFSLKMVYSFDYLPTGYYNTEGFIHPMAK